MKVAAREGSVGEDDTACPTRVKRIVYRNNESDR